VICHKESEINRVLLPRWLASFSEIVGIVVLEERPSRIFKRIRHEVRRVGWLRMFDILAMRIYYRLFLERLDKRARRERNNRLLLRHPDPDRAPEVLTTHSPNTPEVEAFIKRLAPDLMFARCKRILTERVFSIPTCGTFVMHPGICPEYRNAHGCFWALANDDLENVGMTLLKVDTGVDTGPVYGYFTYGFEEVDESHITIMERVVLDNLDPIRDKLLEIWRGEASTVDTSGRRSGVWGQPWLSKYLRWKRRARERNG
jgi:hypothetical protein